VAPDCILDLVIPYEPSRSLRSSGRGLLSVPESRMQSKGDRALAIRAPRLWNNLPEDIRLSESESSQSTFLSESIC